MGAFDATTKYLIERHAADFLALAGVAVGRRPVRVVDAELTTITSVPDKIVIIGRGRRRVAVHVEFQTGRDVDIDERVLAYNVLAHRRHRMAVRSIVFALTPAAVPPGVRGSVRWAGSDGSPLSFDYQLIRVWRLPVAAVLAGGLGTLPMAPVVAVSRADVPAVIRHMRDRLDREVPPQKAGEMWTATRILMGLRYDEPVVDALLQGVRHMRESATYQAIVNEGRAEGVAQGRVEGVAQGRVEGERDALVRVGTHKFGNPSPAVRARLNAIGDAATLGRLLVRVFDRTSWEDLLGD